MFNKNKHSHIHKICYSLGTVSECPCDAAHVTSDSRSIRYEICCSTNFYLISKPRIKLWTVHALSYLVRKRNLQNECNFALLVLRPKRDKLIKCCYTKTQRKRLCTVDLPRLYYGLTLIPAWISNYLPGKVRYEIIHPFSNLNSCTVEF